MKKAKEKRLIVALMAVLLIAVFVMPILANGESKTIAEASTPVAPTEPVYDVGATWKDLNAELSSLNVTHRHFADSVYTSHEYPIRELPAGNYVLTADLEMDCVLHVVDGAIVNLNLNGYMLKKGEGINNYQNGNGVLEVGNSDMANTTQSTLNIFDEVVGGRTRGEYDIYDGRYPTKRDQKVKITGGVITGTSSVIDDIHTVDVETNGILNFCGGTVAGNYTDHGSGIFVHEGGVANLFEDVTISHNFANFFSVVESSGELNICGAVIEKNYAMRDYGAVYITKGTTTMFSGKIRENVSGKGTLKVITDATFVMHGGSINNNVSEENGGGIDVQGGTCKIIAADPSNLPTIKENKAELKGGGINVYNGTLEIDGATIDGNSTISMRGAGNGGGIFAINESTVSIKNATISNNTSKGKSTYENSRYGYYASAGGGIYLNGSELKLGDGVIIKDNHSLLDGGGIYAYAESKVTIEEGADVTVSGNDTEVNGGGICIEGGSNITNHGDLTISDNDSKSDGGGLYVYNNSQLQNTGTINVEDNTTLTDGGGINAYGGVRIQNDGEINLSGNTADITGGGMQISGGCSLTNNGTLDIGETTKTANSAPNGGGLCVEQGGLLFNNDELNITNNEAENGGGGYLHQGGRIINYSDLNVSENTATQNGGGLTVKQSGELIVIGEATVSNNEAVNGGGMHFDYGGTLTSSGDLTVIGNTATENGGGIANDGGVLKSDDLNIESNTAGESGGGVYQKYVMMIQGETVIDDNESGLPATEDNVALVQDKHLLLSGPLDSGSHIGLNVDNPTINKTVVDGTSGYDVNITDDFFTYDGNTYDDASNTNSAFIANHGIEDGDGSPHIMLLNEGPDLFEPHICENPITPGNQDGWYPIYMLDDGTSDKTFYVSNMHSPVQEGDVIPPGYYYLASDIEVKITIPIYNDVHICMNGHDIKKIDSADGGPVFEVGRPTSMPSTVDQSELTSPSAVLNIYGHINSSTPSYGQWSDVDYGAEYKITPTPPTSGEYDTIGGGYIAGGNGGIKILDGATVNMHGGTIAGNVATGNGGGVLVEAGGTLNVHEGAIMGNKAVNGGGIYAGGDTETSNVTLNGEYAFVKNNRAQTNGGGIYLDNATMQMDGNSDVLQNKAYSTGGGIYIDEDSELKMKTGVISGNSAVTAGGVYMNGKLDLSGSPNISSNKDDNAISTTEGRSNIYLPDTKTITISDDLATGSHVGVLTESSADDTLIAVSANNYPITTLDGHFIVSDDTDFAANRDGALNNDTDTGATIKLCHGDNENFVEHQCDTESCHDNCAEQGKITKWHPIATLHALQNMTPSATEGYYLVFNMKTTEVIEISNEINLCLNGFDIKYTGTGNTPVFKVTSTGKFNLYGHRCADNRYGYWAHDGGYHVVKTETEVPQGVDFDIIQGGMITSAITSTGSGVLVEGGGEFNMYGGTIAGNSRENGAGVRLETVASGTGAAFNMQGGAIVGNKATGNGGGVFVGLNGTFAMSDNAQIANNKAKNGAGIYIEETTDTAKKATVTINDEAQVSNNGADKNGGGIYVGENGDLTVSENAQIIENTAGENGGGIYVCENGDLTVSENAQIAKNTAGANGGGVYLEKNSSLSLEDNAKITENQADKLGGGVFGEIDSKANMSDNAQITNNKAGSEGGGTYILGDLTVSGDIKIKDNTANGENDNTALAGTTILVDSAGLGNAEIGVTIVGNLADGATVDIIASDTIDEVSANCFTSDNDDYKKEYIAGDGVPPINKIALSYDAPPQEKMEFTKKLNVGGGGNSSTIGETDPSAKPVAEIPTETQTPKPTQAPTQTPELKTPTGEEVEKECKCCWFCDKVLPFFGIECKCECTENGECSCPKFLGICKCVWILIIIIIVITITACILIHCRKKDDTNPPEDYEKIELQN